MTTPTIFTKHYTHKREDGIMDYKEKYEWALHIAKEWYKHIGNDPDWNNPSVNPDWIHRIYADNEKWKLLGAMFPELEHQQRETRENALNGVLSHLEREKLTKQFLNDIQYDSWINWLKELQKLTTLKWKKAKEDLDGRGFIRLVIKLNEHMRLVSTTHIKKGEYYIESGDLIGLIPIEPEEE